MRSFLGPPPLEAFTPREQRLIARLRTPRRVQRWLSSLPYNWERSGETLRGLRSVLRHRSAHCLEAAISAAALLEHHAYPPLLVSFASIDKLDHVIYVFRWRGRWGSIARSRDPGLTGRKPLFPSVRSLVVSYMEPYVDETGRIVGYGLADLRDLGRYDWRFSMRNRWKVEQWLIDYPHKRIAISDRRYRELHRRYVEYKRRHHGRKPVYYADRHTWWR